MSDRIFVNDIIIKEVAADLGLPIETVKNMINSQSSYVKEVIESNTFDFVRLPYLGVFKSKPKELMVLQYIQGMTPEQASKFKKDIRTGKIKLDSWKDKKKKENETGN